MCIRDRSYDRAQEISKRANSKNHWVRVLRKKSGRIQSRHIKQTGRETRAEFCQISKCCRPPWETLWSGLDADRILGDDS